MNERKECKKLDGKDLINIGIFTAIYFVVVFAVAMLGMIPIFWSCLLFLYRWSEALFLNCS